MKKELIDKLYISFVISIIISIVICSITYLWDKNSLNVSFIKDIFSIVMSIIAPYIAILLFTDWKEQHNKTQFSSQAREIIIQLNEDLKYLSNIMADIRHRDKNDLIWNEDLFSKLSKGIEDFADQNQQTSSSSHLLFMMTKDHEYRKIKLIYDNFTLTLLNEMHHILTDSQAKVGHLFNLIEKRRIKMIELNENLIVVTRSYFLYE
ncbi:hypothetical protein [Acinetobacter pittii]|uniref:hypothetical protein n=1 Tax=Acinetobacter pittii TaxID=48296 RepID=UPI003018C257